MIKINEKKRLSRASILNIVILIVFFVFSLSLVKIQIIDRDIYVSKDNFKSSHDVVVQSARGEILDRNGNPLVINRQGNSLVFNNAEFPSSKEQEKRNEIIFGLIKLFEERGEEYINDLPILIDGSGNFVFEEERESDVEWLKSSDMLNLNSYATAQNCVDEIVRRYKLEKYSKEDALKIGAVCTQMKKSHFSNPYPYTFAKDVSTELVSSVLENNKFYKGVENSVEAYREYVDGTIAPHIIGRVGPISAEKYKEKKNEQNKIIEKMEKKKTNTKEIQDAKRDFYTLTDEYGEFGIERYAEEYLRGKRGVKTVTKSVKDEITEDFSVEPKQGDTVILTIDKNLQLVAQQALKNRVDSLKVQTRLPCAAAVVVIEVNTGEILACATYPSYDMNTYQDLLKEMAEAKKANSDQFVYDSPLVNRALMGAYEPGSTFKPLVAIAALETGTITESTRMSCNGFYTHFKDMRPFRCQGRHGSLDVVNAIDRSCNVFFYETGRLLGIEKINEYGSMFGLGQATGVELPEAVGTLASKENREARGGKWYPGDTIQAAIGQSDNQFTPIQIANYAATIANGGTRYVPHFIKSIKSYDYSKTVLEREPEIAVETGISKRSMDFAREGMLKVGTTGFCARDFSGLPVQAAAKTGTSEIVKRYNGQLVEGNNGFLITFAPYENPEIAMGIVVETANKGSQTAMIAREIYDYYFSNKGVGPAQNYNELLS